MKTKITLTGVSVFLYIFFFIPSAHANVIISEFSIGKYIGGKATSTNGDDFIELYNTGGICVPLEGWRLRKRIQSGTESPLYSFKKGDAIMPNDFLLWVSSKAKSDYQKLADVMPTPSQEYTLSGNNSVALLDDKNTAKDAITFGGGHTEPFSSPVLLNPGDGLSKERDPSSLEWKDTGITPNPTKSALIADNDLDGDGCPDPIVPVPPTPNPAPTPTPIPTVKTIRLNEVFPNPSAKGDDGEFIELFNFGTEPTDISGWEILDALAIKKKSEGETFTKIVFPEKYTIEPQQYLVVPNKDVKLSVTLNNTNEILSLFNKNGEIINSMNFKTSKNDVSLNYTSAGWRGGIPTPGAANQPNTLPETKEKIPKKGYRGVPVLFDARGKDSDGGKLKYTWDFGDGHKSYKEETSHTYEDTGTYPVTLTTTDGSDDVVETFSLVIQSMPKPNVRITAMIPNPTGKDSDAEWLMIENRGKKAVDQKGFGIATGWKKLVNHPVRESFVIEPKGEAKLTREFSLFTLPNEKGKIELRAPDGDVLQKIKYKLDKSVAEDVVYKKEKGSRWAWQEKEATPDTAEAETPQTISPEIPETTQEIEPLPAPEEVPEDTEEIVPQAQPEPKKLSLLPLLNYGTHVTLPENIRLTFDDTSRIAAPLETEHYALTFAKTVLSDINTTLNAVQNKK
ncbi:MAG: lamin tail domain-containing protein [Candidatus Moraniibacteriota bacterium]